MFPAKLSVRSDPCESGVTGAAGYAYLELAIDTYLEELGLRKEDGFMHSEDLVATCDSEIGEFAGLQDLQALRTIE